jgi:hypothetical protein
MTAGPLLRRGNTRSLYSQSRVQEEILHRTTYVKFARWESGLDNWIPESTLVAKGRSSRNRKYTSSYNVASLLIGLPIRPALMLSARELNVKLLLVGGLLGLTVGVSLTVLYFSLARFFVANARALDRNQKAAEQMARETEMAQSPQVTNELEGSQKSANKTAAKAGN